MQLSNDSFLLLIISVIVTVSVPNLVSAQFSSFTYKWCSDNTTYTPNSTYQSNLKAAVNSLTIDNRITKGFYNSTAGQGPDKVSSLALCRGDVPVNTCRLCIQDSATSLLGPDGCPNQKQAFGYSGYCSIFISNGSVYGQVQDVVQPWYITTSDNVSNADGFNKSLSSLMSLLQHRAASGTNELKYATGTAKFSGGQTLYGLVQCTPDLSKRSCMQCTQEAFDLLPTCCVQPNYKASGVKIVLGSCFVRYELSPFYDNVPNLSMPLPPHKVSSNSTEVRKSKMSRIVRASTITLGLSTLLVISIIFSILSRRKKMRKSWMVKLKKDEIEALQSLQFSLGTIKHATQNFSDVNKLGQGGFGSVYKGVLSDGQEIAVKRLLRNSAQGDPEFKNEILILAKLRHRNLVRLLGFCLQEKEMILVYEFVANRSLDNFIFDPTSRQAMQWETRYKIINGIARGMLYLHEDSRLKIIHRDLKAGNVLLDADFHPKIADFGLARIINIDQTLTLASKIVGTLGYISPEYALERQVSVKSDVYSFGVLVLEIISGQKITSLLYDGENQENLLSFAWRNWIHGTTCNLVDPAIAAGSSTEIFRCVHIGLLCVQDNPADRPTMSSVVLMLSSNSVSLQAPLQPAFCTESQSLPNMLLQWSSTTRSSSRSVGVSNNGDTITELHPR